MEKKLDTPKFLVDEARKLQLDYMVTRDLLAGCFSAAHTLNTSRRMLI